MPRHTGRNTGPCAHGHGMILFHNSALSQPARGASTCSGYEVHVMLLAASSVPFHVFVYPLIVNRFIQEPDQNHYIGLSVEM